MWQGIPSGKRNVEVRSANVESTHERSAKLMRAAVEAAADVADILARYVHDREGREGAECVSMW